MNFGKAICRRKESIARPLSAFRLFSTTSCRAADPDGDNDDEDHAPCEHCTAFRVLGLPASFKIDPDELKKSYRALMTNYHPDKHSALPQSQRDEHEGRAAVVTRAFDTLKDPHTRAVHLLEVLGHPMMEKASGELVGTEFLMYIMEIRESIQLADDDRVLKRMQLENQQRMDETCDELASAFEAQNYEKALELTARLQYWHRIDETIREKVTSVD